MVDFIDDVRTRSKRFQTRLAHLNTEEATKNSLVMPFIQMLGYNLFDPTEVVPEFTADFGSKKGEKVDYALMLDGKPVVLIEAKRYGATLRVEQESQLFRYFSASSARFGILTDGVTYRFYSDLEEPGRMDQRPFFEFNMLSFTDEDVEQLKQFHRESFDPKESVEAARDLKYTNEVKRALGEEMRNPTEEFVRFILARIEYPGTRTKTKVEQFTPLVQRAFTHFVKDIIDARLKSALDRENDLTDEPAAEAAPANPQPLSLEYPVELVMGVKGVQARARFADDRTFLVLAGSGVVKEELPTLPNMHVERRKALRESGILVDEGDSYRLVSDQTFTSPSGAACFVAGASRDGYTAWRDAQGRNLGDLYHP